MIVRFLCAAVIVLGGALGIVSAAGASPAVQPASSELVYVANADSGPVTAYPAGATGAVQPVRTVDNPQNPQTYWAPWGVTFDAASNLYVQTFLSDATSFVFSPASPTPRRIFRAAGPDTESIAVDGQGYEYVIGGEGPPIISVAAPGANGRPANLYTVPPVRQIQTNQPVFSPWPSLLAVDNQNNLIVAVNGSTSNAIEVFQGGPTGSSTPLRTIAGSLTGLGSCAGFGACDHIAVAYSSLTGQIYAAVSTVTGGHISVFPGQANGNARPLRTIAGSQTGLDGNVVTGIAISRHTGDVFVLAKAAQFAAPAAVEVFGRSASGNAAPLRRFTDGGTGLVDGEGIALTH